MNYKLHIVGIIISAFFSANAMAAPASCRVVVNSALNQTAEGLTEQQVIDLVKNSKSYQDRRNKDWKDTNQCLCCHTTLPYMLSRGLDQKSKSNFNAFKEMAASKVENPAEAPWYDTDHGGKNSNPTQAVINALTLVMYDISSGAPLSSTTLKSMNRIFEYMNANGKIHWLDYDLQPFESKKGELWGNSMAVLTLELAQKNSTYQPNSLQYAKLKQYIMSQSAELKPHEMSVLLWAHSLNSRNDRVMSKVLTPEQTTAYVEKIVSVQNANGSWNQKEVLGQGLSVNDVYSTSIAMIGLIKAGYGNTVAIHNAAKWLASQQQMGDFLRMGEGTVLWPVKSMNRESRILNNRFASDVATTYASLALETYRLEVLRSSSN